MSHILYRAVPKYTPDPPSVPPGREVCTGGQEGTAARCDQVGQTRPPIHSHAIPAYSAHSQRPSGAHFPSVATHCREQVDCFSSSNRRSTACAMPHLYTSSRLVVTAHAFPPCFFYASSLPPRTSPSHLHRPLEKRLVA